MSDLIIAVICGVVLAVCLWPAICQLIPRKDR